MPCGIAHSSRESYYDSQWLRRALRLRGCQSAVLGGTWWHWGNNPQTKTARKKTAAR